MARLILHRSHQTPVQAHVSIYITIHECYRFGFTDIGMCVHSLCFAAGFDFFGEEAPDPSPSVLALPAPARVEALARFIVL